MTAPGGRFVFSDDHRPALAHTPGGRGLPWRRFDHIRGAEPLTAEAVPDHADPGFRPRRRCDSWVAALERAGLRVRGLREYEHMQWRLLPCRVAGDGRSRRLPPRVPRLRLLYSFEAVHDD